MEKLKVGVVGLGLMGCSIITTFLIADHHVIAIVPIESDEYGAIERIDALLKLCKDLQLLTKPVEHYLSHLTITRDYQMLVDCELVQECVIENIEIKKSVYKRITEVVTADAIIATNTSAIPISELQINVDHPERFMGIHWAEPAFATRFLEIICGIQTSRINADRVYQLAHVWGKEPTLLRKDLKGFITNRLMYAVYREALTLIEDSAITIEDADKACRYDMGAWITLMGIFRRMDYMGLQDFNKMLGQLIPLLSNRGDVPFLMQEMVKRHSRGIHNMDGLYGYSAEQADLWKQTFADFNKEIFEFASQHPVMKDPN